ncbi:hypothetical protein KJK32_35920 [Streptomyces sp. JCM17656]|nr:hypothetical protein KJK32_35920 [Streptomyces sp. JCM17656]
MLTPSDGPAATLPQPAIHTALNPLDALNALNPLNPLNPLDALSPIDPTAPLLLHAPPLHRHTRHIRTNLGTPDPHAAHTFRPVRATRPIRIPRHRGALRALLHGSSSGRVGTWGHYGGLLLTRQAP